VILVLQIQPLLLLEPEKFHEHYFIVPGGIHHPEKRMVKRSDYQDMKLAIELVRELEVEGYPKGFLFDPRFGYPEVVVVWDDPMTGIRCRAKHDFFCWEWSVDYKTTKDLGDDALWQVIRRNRYSQQQVHYTRGRKVVRQMLKDGLATVHGEFSEKFVEEFLKATDDFFPFLFQEAQRPFEIELPMIDCDGSLERAADDIDRALGTYQSCMKKYGTQPWKDSKKRFRSFSSFYGFAN